MDLVLATSSGAVTCAQDGEEWRVYGRALEEHDVTSVIAREGVILAGTTDGVYRSDDAGQTWQEASDGLEVRHVRRLAFHPHVSDFEVAGTEPAAIFISRDGARTWQPCPEVAQLRDQFNWYLPYSPRAGCIRGLALHGRRAYAGAEVGGVLRSLDGGETWTMAPGSAGEPLRGTSSAQVHSDVHDVAVHASSPELVLAATGGGLYRSEDGGETWVSLYRCYCRGLWWDADDAEHIIFGPADGVGRRGRIEETRDGGKSWQTLSRGLETPWTHHMVERMEQVGDALFAVLSNGQLAAATLPVNTWRTVLSEAGTVRHLAALGDG